MKRLLSSLIFVLLRTTCPFAIRWAVVSVIVLSFDAESFGANSHVVGKQLKSPPSFAHADSPASVVLERIIFWIPAPLANITPRPVKVVAGHAMRLSDEGKDFGLQTSARTRSSTKYASGEYPDLNSAIANAVGIGHSFFVARNRDQRESRIFLPDPTFRIAAFPSVCSFAFSHTPSVFWFVVSGHSLTQSGDGRDYFGAFNAGGQV